MTLLNHESLQEGSESKESDSLYDIDGDTPTISFN